MRTNPAAIIQAAAVNAIVGMATAAAINATFVAARTVWTTIQERQAAKCGVDTKEDCCVAR